MAGGGLDAGNRVVSVVDLALYAQLDGGFVGFPRAQETVNAVFLLPDAGALRFPLVSDGGGQFVAAGVPEGEWLAEVVVPGDVTRLTLVNGDTAELSSVVGAGRPPGPLVSNPSRLSLELTSLDPWVDRDSIEITSLSSNTVLFVEPVTASMGDTRVTETVDTFFARGPPITTADVFRVQQRRFLTTSDAGNPMSTMVRWAESSGRALPSQPLVMALQEFPVVATVSLAFDAGQLRNALDGLDPRCDVFFNEQLASSTMLEYPLASLGLTTLEDRVTLRSVSPVIGTTASCRGDLFLKLPLLDGGLERASDGSLATLGESRRLARSGLVAADGGVVAPPLLSVPRAPLIEGSAAPLFVSPTPRLEWTAPSSGTPVLYSVSFSEIEPRGTFWTRRPVVALQTTRTWLLVPPGLLQREKRYVVLIAATDHVIADSRIPASTSWTFSEVFWVR